MKGSEMLGLLKLQTQSSHKAQNGKSSKELPVSLKLLDFMQRYAKKQGLLYTSGRALFVQLLFEMFI